MLKIKTHSPPAPRHDRAVSSAQANTRADFLLEVAAQSFLQKGFEATSVGEIARRAHASKETFYSKFTNKNELFRAVMRRLMDRFASDISSVFAEQTVPRQALAAFGNLFLNRMLSDEGVGLQKIVFMESQRFPEVAAIFYESGPRRTLEVLTAYLESQVKKGTMRSMDAKLAAGQLIGLLVSDLMILRSLGVLSMPSRDEQVVRIEAAVDVFLRAYGAER